MTSSEEPFNSITPKQLENQTKKNMKDFDTLVDSLSNAHDKKKELWKQIYQNAVTDRRNAYIMFTDLYTNVHNSTSEHAIHGATLAKYMERLTKSNDQLIKLAEIIDDAVTADEEDMLDDTDTIYASLEGSNE